MQSKLGFLNCFRTDFERPPGALCLQPPWYGLHRTGLVQSSMSRPRRLTSLLHRRLLLVVHIHQSALFLLFECASGYALFERLESEEIGQELADVQKSVTDLQRFGKVVKLKSFVPFKSAAHALENINDVTEGAALGR